MGEMLICESLRESKAVVYTKLFDENSIAIAELRSHRIILKWPHMVNSNSYHQKTLLILKSNVMSKSKYQCYISTNKIFGKKIIKVL